jgi:hypothetical protein
LQVLLDQVNKNPNAQQRFFPIYFEAPQRYDTFLNKKNSTFEKDRGGGGERERAPMKNVLFR